MSVQIHFDQRRGKFTVEGDAVMEDIDSLLDSLVLKNEARDVSYVDEQDAKSIKVKQIPSKGDGLFAERPLLVSDPICSLGYPTMMAIDSDLVPNVCYHCLAVTATHLPLPSYGNTPVDLMMCNGCHFARFCGRDCQVKSWRAYHKYECKVFKKRKNDQLHAIARAVLRVVLLKDRDLLPSEDFDRIRSLVAHEEILTAGRRSNLTELAEGIKHLAESSMSVEMIQRLIFIMRANATELPTTLNGAIGVMLNPLIAKLNHSCEPNVAIYRPSGWADSTEDTTDGRKVFTQIIPLRDIQEGEELLLCYVDPTASVEARKEKLKDEYLFDCNCVRCAADVKSHGRFHILPFWESGSRCAHVDTDSRSLCTPFLTIFITQNEMLTPRSTTDAEVDENAGLVSQFETWTKEVEQHIAKAASSPKEFRRAVKTMDKAEHYLEHPALFTIGTYPDSARTLILLGLKNLAYDEALINALRLYFLVNPRRFIGEHNPTNVYTFSLLLDVLDAILGISNPSGATDDRRKQWLDNLASRGLSRRSLIYWRQRICEDLMNRLKGSASKDICALVEQREKEAPKLADEDADGTAGKDRETAGEEMRKLLN